MADNLEERKVKALESIAETLDLMLEWVEEIDKEGWSDRLQWYLSMWKEKYIDEEDNSESVKSKRGRK